jgi:hypothetical protein
MDWTRCVSVGGLRWTRWISGRSLNTTWSRQSCTTLPTFRSNVTPSSSGSKGNAKQPKNSCFSSTLRTSTVKSLLIFFFYLWVLHPVAHLSNWFFMTPSIATKFQYINSLLFSFLLHVSAPTGHLQVWYTIRYSQRTIFNTTDLLHVRNLM